jgi:guanylate kinase
MARSGLVVVISGPSGVGKGAVHAGILGLLTGIDLSISVTTRTPRPGEQDGVAYHFLDEAGFDSMVARGELLEWAVYAGNRYGTPRAPVTASVEAGRTVLLEVEVQGAIQVRETLPEALLIFLVPPSYEELERRLRDRGTEDDETIEARMDEARREMGIRDRFDHVVVNDDLEDAIQVVASLIERARVGL